MLAWHELVDRDHDLLNPTSTEKIRLVGSYLRLGAQTSVLDLACGKAGPALILAQEYGCQIHGVDVSPVFIEEARRRIARMMASSTCRRRWHAWKRPAST